jgi:hypothetical protein
MVVSSSGSAVDLSSTSAQVRIWHSARCEREKFLDSYCASKRTMRQGTVYNYVHS